MHAYLFTFKQNDCKHYIALQAKYDTYILLTHNIKVETAIAVIEH